MSAVQRVDTSRRSQPGSIGILAVVQLYFLLRPRTFASRVSTTDEAWQVPWILLCDGNVERMAAIFSSIVVPRLAASDVAIRTELIDSEFIDAWRMIAAIAIVGIAVPLAHYTRSEPTRLWRVRHTSPCYCRRPYVRCSPGFTVWRKLMPLQSHRRSSSLR